MHEYQNENNPAKMLSVGEKVLQLDPDNPIALVLTATVLADSLSDADTDRQAKIARVRKNASHALETVDSSFVPPANATPEQINANTIALYNNMKRLKLDVVQHVPIHGNPSPNADFERTVGPVAARARPAGGEGG